MKSQAGIELMIFVSILLLAFTSFLIGNFSFQSELITTKTSTEAQKICDEIGFEINTAVRAGNGYERNFFVEDSFFGVSEYNITVQNYTVYLDWDKGSITSTIITDNIIGSVEEGWNMIKNTGGKIYVT